MKRIWFYIVLVLLLGGISFAGYKLYYPSKVRYAVFAGYNKDKRIAPYVIHYLKGLNEVCDGVVYIADSELLPEEYDKIKDLVIYTEHKRHEEYDFGSYKRGFNWLRDNGYLAKADEVIFANDSTYAPMTSFKPMFREMDRRRNLDFWGNSQNVWGDGSHVQTYFLVIRNKVIQSRAFTQFINRVVHHEHSSEYITNYEIALTPMLENLGYKWDSYVPHFSKHKKSTETDTCSYPFKSVLVYHSQFVKRRLFTRTLLMLEDMDKLVDWIKNYAPQIYHFIEEDFPNDVKTD